ncbi:SagB/ThcOx family dehydrogenase [bacterium]|nr:SagB/ThcOx family dehydrogenase [bacterium]
MDVMQSYFYRYHNLTKHTAKKLFASGRSLDWANQPNPFRHYEGVELIELPVEIEVNGVEFFDMPAPNAVPFDIRFLSSLLYHSFAISAWKQVVGTNHKWALRVNPSSGNLHPTEVHLFFEGGAFHYRVDEHKLEKRSALDLRKLLWSELGLNEKSLPPLLICLSSIFWREAWKYESRAFRYCQHDLGHALAALEVAAGEHGWSTVNYGLFDDKKMTGLLGLSENQEHPLAFVALYPERQESFRFEMTNTLLSNLDNDTKIEFRSEVNQLSTEQINYPLIEKVFESTCYDKDKWIDARKEFTAYDIKSKRSLIEIMFGEDQAKIDQESISCTFPNIKNRQIAKQVIRTRRSAVDMDGETAISKEVLDAILLNSTKGFNADFQTLKEDQFNLVHLFLYLHRVEGVTPGLYYFDRQQERLIALRKSDQRQFARSASCFQDIASDGVFAVSMVADFNTGMEVFGERCYRVLHHEAGHIGQHFYLTSHALGLDATGIGCFIDDEINSYIALPSGFEVIYNFTFGSALKDPRLTTLKAYDFTPIQE